MTKLTKRERDTLNAAMEIILRHTPRNAKWRILAYNDHGVWSGCFVSYFDSYLEKHELLSGFTFADRVQMALGLEKLAQDEAAANRDAHIETLRKRLASLEGTKGVML